MIIGLFRCPLWHSVRWKRVSWNKEWRMGLPFSLSGWWEEAEFELFSVSFPDIFMPWGQTSLGLCVSGCTLLHLTMFLKDFFLYSWVCSTTVDIGPIVLPGECTGGGGGTKACSLVLLPARLLDFWLLRLSTSLPLLPSRPRIDPCLCCDYE